MITLGPYLDPMEPSFLQSISEVKEDSLLGLIYKDSLQPTIRAVGNALKDVFEFGMIPTLYLHNATEKVRLNLKHNLDNYSKKIEAIPTIELIPVNPQIGVPILEKLIYTTNEDIAEFYLNLLTRASSSQTVNEAHPAFITIIERLTPDEARIINIIRNDVAVPFIEFYEDNSEKNQTNAKLLLKGFALHFSEEIMFRENLEMYFNNLYSCGLFQGEDGATYDYDYDALQEKLLNMLLTQHGSSDGLRFAHQKNSYYEISGFGKRFIQACTE